MVRRRSRGPPGRRIRCYLRLHGLHHHRARAAAVPLLSRTVRSDLRNGRFFESRRCDAVGWLAAVAARRHAAAATGRRHSSTRIDNPLGLPFKYSRVPDCGMSSIPGVCAPSERLFLGSAQRRAPGGRDQHARVGRVVASRSAGAAGRPRACRSECRRLRAGQRGAARRSDRAGVRRASRVAR